MAYILKFQVVGDQEAINKTKRVYSEGEKSATSSAGKIKDRFRDVFENVTQNATGAFGSVAGGLFKLPGPAGVAAAAILAVGGAAVAAASKYAASNAANDKNAAAFLVTLEKLKGTFSGLVDTVGKAAVGAFVALADAFGQAATQQEILLRQQRAYDDLILKMVGDTDDFVKKLNQIIDADAKLDETTLLRDYFAAFAAGNVQLAQAYAKQLQQLRLMQTARKNLADLERRQSVGAQTIANKTKEVELEKQIDVSQAGRKAFLEGRALAEKAYADNQKRNLDRQSREEEFQESRRKAADERARAALQAQEAAARALGNTMRSFVLSSLEQIVFEGGKFHDILKEITRSALRLGFRLITQGIFGGGFENGGVLGRIPQAANGMHVTRDSLIRVGERNLPEVIIPLAPEKRARANELLAQSGLTAGNQTINFAPVIYANNADRNLVRELMVQFNRETKRGARLFATNQKSNRR